MFSFLFLLLLSLWSFSSFFIWHHITKLLIIPKKIKNLSFVVFFKRKCNFPFDSFFSESKEKSVGGENIRIIKRRKKWEFKTSTPWLGLIKWINSPFFYSGFFFVCCGKCMLPWPWQPRMVKNKLTFSQHRKNDTFSNCKWWTLIIWY